MLRLYSLGDRPVASLNTLLKDVILLKPLSNDTTVTGSLLSLKAFLAS
mgnify:CR=1 FL=1